ncbi:MAG: ClpXP protease specificity-enhancing factor SspB [Sphingomonadales bacterium]
MTESHIDYQALVHKALKGAVRDILLRIAAEGLVGDHHYYITFKTEAEGVLVPKRMQTQYPNEMTIVIQHRFWDLNVYEDFFEIGLSFNQRAEHLVIPFEAITSLVDPSVRFALQFDGKKDDQDDTAEALLFDDPGADEDAGPTFAEDTTEGTGNGGNVVPLDAYRKG